MKKKLYPPFIAVLLLSLLFLICSCSKEESTPHTHTPAESVRENEIPATCASDGSYNEVIYCSQCSAEISRTQKSSQKTNSHNFDNGVCTVCNKDITSKGLKFSLSADKTCYSLSGIGSCKDTDIIIPASYNDLPVTSIEYRSFSYNESITSVSIPSSITSIGDQAFYNCSELKSVTIPKSVTFIGDNAFYNCTNLTGVYITDIAAWCGINFSNYTANPLCYANNLYLNEALVRELIIPDNVDTINTMAFANCKNLVRLTLPDSLKVVGDHAFYSCTNLISLTLGKNLTSIETSAFNDCYKLAEIYNLSNIDIVKNTSLNGSVAHYALNVYTPASGNSKLREIGDGFIFYEDVDACYLLGYTGDKTDITLPESCNGKTYDIYKYAFYNYVNLTSVTIPSSVTSIGDYAFYYCKSLTSVTIPNSVTSIGEWAFYGCKSIEAVYITDIAAWCNISFSDYYSNPLYYAKNLYLNGQLVTELVIPEGVTTIGDYAFYYCKSLTSITIPDSVTSIGDYAFSSCTSLTSIKYKGSAAQWNSISKGSYWNYYIGNYAITYNYKG